MQRDVSEQLCINRFKTFYTAYARVCHGYDTVGICRIFLWNIQCNNKLPQNIEVRCHLMCTRH